MGPPDRRKRRKRPKRRTSAASNIPQKVPEETVAPGTEDYPPAELLFSPDSTSGVETEESESRDYAATAPAFLDKFLQGRIPLPKGPVLVLLTFVWLGFFSWLFAQDNSAGRIEDLSGLKNFGVKAIIYTVVCFAVAGLITLILKSVRR